MATPSHSNSRILRVASLAGELLLINGAEISRVEDVIVRIGRAAGARRVEGFAIPTGLFVSIEGEDGESLTRIRRIPDLDNNLSAVAAVNEISRQLARGTIDLFEAEKRLIQLKTAPPLYSTTVRALAAGVGSASFTAVFGGQLPDMLAAVLAGVLVFIVGHMTQPNIGVFLRAWAGGITATFTAIAANRLAPQVALDMVIVGGIMILVPGVATTNALRDLMSGELLAGLSRGGEAIGIAAAVAGGVLFGLAVAF